MATIPRPVVASQYSDSSHLLASSRHRLSDPATASLDTNHLDVINFVKAHHPEPRLSLDSHHCKGKFQGIPQTVVG